MEPWYFSLYFARLLWHFWVLIRLLSGSHFRLGLWSHCFRSLPDPLDQYQRRFFVGCRWVYDPFTTGYDRIRGYLLPGGCFVAQSLNSLWMKQNKYLWIVYSSLIWNITDKLSFPGFMIATQFFYTLCLLGVLISTILVLIFFLCCSPDQRRFVAIIKTIGFIMLASGT